MQEKSIYHAFLVWMGKSICLASCSMASLVTAYAALRPQDGFSHPHQEHMKDTYNPAKPGIKVVIRHVIIITPITCSAIYKRKSIC